MAITVSQYDHTAKKIFNKEITYTTLKVMLLNDSATFTAANTQLTEVTNAGANQVSGNGWAAGGVTIANVTITVVDTNDAMLDGDNISVTASGGSIGPAFKAVIYDDTDANDAPLWFIDFGGSLTATVGNAFQFIWSASGLVRILTS